MWGNRNKSIYGEQHHSDFMTLKWVENLLEEFKSTKSAAKIPLRANPKSKPPLICHPSPHDFVLRSDGAYKPSIYGAGIGFTIQDKFGSTIVSASIFQQGISSAISA